MIEILIRLLLFLLSMWFGIPIGVAFSPVRQVEVTPVVREDGQMADGSIISSPLVIENVDTIVMESYPYQVNLAVTGYQPDGCNFPIQVEQRREGNTVIVSIYRELDISVMCPQVITPYEETIRLDGGFESGSYTIQVNDYRLQLDL